MASLARLFIFTYLCFSPIILKADSFRFSAKDYTDSVEAFHMQHNIRRLIAKNNTRSLRVAYGVFRATWISNLAMGRALISVLGGDFDVLEFMNSSVNLPAHLPPSDTFMDSRIGYAQDFKLSGYSYMHSFEYGFGSMMTYNSPRKLDDNSSLYIYPYLSLRI